MATTSASEDAELNAVWQQLLNRWPESQLEPSLSRIASIMTLLGDPQAAYPVIHVTGTNGKTSTARMIEILLRSYGLRTGLFTSPHLVDPRERICLDGEPVSKERFLETWRDLSPYVDLVDRNSQADGGPAMSFFEVMTALAFATFADAPVDVAVIEVGMGGAWDATNVAHGQVAVITPIALDHQQYLGDTIAEIATEKAGIIKPGAFAVLAAQDEEASAVLAERIAEVGAIAIREGVEFGLMDRVIAVGGQMLSLQGIGGRIDEVFLPLFGEHQARNAALALAAVEAFMGAGKPPVDDDVIRAGFDQASSPGRLEIVRRSPTVLIDAAHNPAGAVALAQALEDSFEFGNLVAVIGVLADKDPLGFLIALEEIVNTVVVTEPASPRALAVESLYEVAVRVFGDDRVVMQRVVADAIDEAVTLAEADAEYGGGGVLVTGSIVLVGEVKQMLQRGRRHL